MEPLWLLSAFGAAFLVSAGSVPLVSRLARALGVIDRPNPRKINQRPNIPLLGGVCVALGFAAALGLIVVARPEDLELPVRIWGFALGGAVMLAIGAIDDRFGLGAAPKLAAQIFAAAIAIGAGLRIEYMTIPVTLQTWTFDPLLSYAVTLFWIIAVTNSMNLLDGIDGVATGVTAIIAATLTLICFFATQVTGVYIGAAFVGALLGFLPFNYPPGRIFLGDAGAYLAGYTLALLALEGYRQAVFLPFVVPLLALTVPLIDTSLSILRRVRDRRRIFKADRQHMHHRLLKLFGSQRAAAHRMYGITFIFCLMSIFITRYRDSWFLVVYLIMVLGLTLNLIRNLGLFAAEGAEADDEAAISAEAASPERNRK